MTELAIRPDEQLVDMGVFTDLAEFGIEMRPTSLTLPADFTFERYERLGSVFGLMHRSITWWIGDWINFGDGALPERYLQAMAATNMAEHTLKNYAWVCGAVPRMWRGKPHRRVGVGISIHSEVASLPVSEQSEWLDLVQMHAWSLMQLRDAMREKGARRDVEQPMWSKNAANPDRTVEVALRIVHEAHPNGDGRYLVDGELIAQLRAAVGADET